MMAKELQMTKDQREIHRKKRILEYAERIGNINLKFGTPPDFHAAAGSQNWI
jgi:hypothetical protein